MSLSDLASIGSCVSGVSVLISLIYLSLQVRQSERNQRAILQQGRAARTTDTMLRLADGDITDAFLKGTRGDDDISLKEIMQFRYAFRAVMFGLEDTYFQHRQTLLDDDAFESTVATLRYSFTTPGYRAAWKLARPMHDPSFVAFVDQLAAEVTVAPPPDEVGRWKTAVAAERFGAGIS